MNRLPLPFALLSVIIAVALWYVATLLEGEPALPPAPPGPVATEFGRQAQDTELVGGALALRCEEAEQRIKDEVEASRYCESDDDCTIFDFGFPIQCLTSVARSDITALRVAFRDYEANCPFRVYYDCPSEPLERRPVCRENRCEVELRTLDQLRDRTLRHLGIDEPGEGD